MKTKNQINHGRKGNFAGFALLLTSIIIFTLSSAFGPRFADLPQEFNNTLPEDEINGLLPELTNNVTEPEKISAVRPIQASIQPANKIPDSTRTSEEKTTIVMEIDEDGNILSVKENGEELEVDKRKEYEKGIQNAKTNLDKEENLKKKEDELNMLQKELEEKQKEMYEAQNAFTEVSSEYFEQLYELDTFHYFPFNDTALDNTWDLLADQNTWELFENQDIWSLFDLAEKEKNLEDLFHYQQLSGNFLEPSDYEIFDEEKFKDLYIDQIEEMEDSFMELEKAQELQRAELLAQIEDIEKIEDVDRLEFESMMLESKITEELVNDKVIKNQDELRSFRLSEKKLLVNGEKQSNKLKDNYLKLYEEITNDKLKGTMRVIFEK